MPVIGFLMSQVAGTVRASSRSGFRQGLQNRAMSRAATWRSSIAGLTDQCAIGCQTLATELVALSQM